jgi:hypothetical protein
MRKVAQLLFAILTGAHKIPIEQMSEGVRTFPETLAKYSTR